MHAGHDGLNDPCRTESIDLLELRLARLQRAIFSGRSDSACLRLWSAFIRGRDGHRCVDCHFPHGIVAHHICRKTYLAEARFLTGNGITLCYECHREVHAGFNGRPDLSLPMDAQGGEKIATMQRLYGALYEDAEDRGLERDDFYFVSDPVLGRFKALQGFPRRTSFPGSRIRQAFLIWWQCQRPIAETIAAANGFNVSTAPRYPGTIYIYLDK